MFGRHDIDRFDGFDVLEKFRDLDDLFLQFGWNKRWHFFDAG